MENSEQWLIFNMIRTQRISNSRKMNIGINSTTTRRSNQQFIELLLESPYRRVEKSFPNIFMDSARSAFSSKSSSTSKTKPCLQYGHTFAQTEFKVKNTPFFSFSFTEIKIEIDF